MSDEKRLLEKITDTMSLLCRETRFQTVLQLLTELTVALVNCDRASFWFWDRAADSLWTLAASGTDTITVPVRSGLVGAAVLGCETLLVNDPYSDSRFNPGVDRQTGYVTRSILTIPLLNSRGEVIGAFQCVNKFGPAGQPAPFTGADERILSVVAAFSGKSLESYRLWEERASILEERERLNAELQVASSIQQEALPRLEPFAAEACFRLAALVRPAREMGGDFFDVYRLPDGRLALTAADVSGKGITAALFMMDAKALLREKTLSSAAVMSPGAILSYVNERLCAGNESGMFVTVWLGILDPASGLLRYASGGHDDPMGLSPEGDFRMLTSPRRLPVATMEEVLYPDCETVLKPGERLLLYTDGATDATNPEEECFGLARLQERWQALAFSAPAQELPGLLLRELDDFSGTAEQFDDITLFLLEYLGPGEER